MQAPKEEDPKKKRMFSWAIFSFKNVKIGMHLQNTFISL